MDRVLATVGDAYDAGAETARNGVDRPRTEGDLAHLVKTADGERRIPERTFLLRKAVADLAQRGA